MIRAALRRFRNELFWIRYFRNWSEITLLAWQSKIPTKIIMRNGVVMEAPKDNTLFEMAKDIFIDNVYNPSGFAIEFNDTVVDIGANIGFFSIFAARQTQKTVYAFEPFPGNVDFLKKNIRANNVSNISVDCLAISDKNGTEKLYLSEISGGHLLFDHNIRGNLHDYVEVPTRTLETMMEEYSINQIGFLKLDCEGSEGQVLKSISGKCWGKIGKIVMEFHDNVSILNHEEIKGLLEDAGFSCLLRWDGRSPFGYLFAKRRHCLHPGT